MVDNVELPISKSIGIEEVESVKDQILKKRSFRMADAIRLGFMYVGARTMAQETIFKERSLGLNQGERSLEEEKDFLSKIQGLRAEGERAIHSAERGNYTDLKRYLTNLAQGYLDAGDKTERGRLGKKLLGMSGKIPDVASPVVSYLGFDEDAA